MTNLFTDYLRGLDPIIEEFHPNCSMTIPEEMVDKLKRKFNTETNSS